MRYWIGGLFFGVAAWLIVAGLAQRRRALATGWREPEAVSPQSLETLGYIMRPIMLFALAYVGLKSAFVYWVIDAGRYLSVVDLGGFLALLAGYGTWFVMKTKYRSSGIVPAVPADASKTAEAANDPVAAPRAAARG